MTQIIKNIAFTMWSVILFALGVFFAIKIDKPDTVVNNSIGKIKGANDVTNTPTTTIDNKKEKKKFRLFRKKERQ
jgi:hypothetical protein